MIKLFPSRKLCCFLIILFCISVSYAQEATRKIIKKVPVGYPLALKQRGIQGDVRLKVLIKADGSVKSTDVLGGNPSLAESAQKSVSQWKFASSDSESNMVVVVHFDPTLTSEN